MPHFYNTIAGGTNNKNDGSDNKLIKHSDIKVQFTEKALTGDKLRMNNYIDPIDMDRSGSSDSIDVNDRSNFQILLEGGEDENIDGEGIVNLPKGDPIGSCSLIISSNRKAMQLYPGYVVYLNSADGYISNSSCDEDYLYD